MKWEILLFEHLSAIDLYSLLRLRSEVFVVEQNCIYQDIDGYDLQSFHVLGKNEKEEVVVYSRLFPPDIKYPNSCSIGRVVVHKEYRNKALGKQLMEISISYLKTEFPDRTISISAQCYLHKFYSDLGFAAMGTSYLEDEIPHQKMVYTE